MAIHNNLFTQTFNNITTMYTVGENTDLKIFESRNIKDYKPVLEGLVDDFGYSYWRAILTWCYVIGDNITYNKKYWQVWLVQYREEVVGICGLFSHRDHNNEELWLGWFGLISEIRNKKFGSDVLKWMEKESKELGAKRILSYVDKNGKPLSFYYKNGYKRLCSVKEYFNDNPDASMNDFGDIEDHVIVKELKI